MPTHTDDILGNDRWGAGPAVVALTMPGKWVVGSLVSQMWDFTHSSDEQINQFLMQPFVNYNFGDGWYAVSAPVITSNWKAAAGDKWTVPVGGGIGRVIHLGKQAVNLRAAFYYNAAHPDEAPEYDLQFTVQFLFPK